MAPELTSPRPDPEQLLRQLEAEEQYERRGRLKVFLGYASGVGKSLRMLDEARRRRERGEDVVVGATQPKENEPPHNVRPAAAGRRRVVSRLPIGPLPWSVRPLQGLILM